MNYLEHEFPTQRDIKRYHKMRDQLVVKMPCFALPVTAVVTYIQQEGDLLQVDVVNSGIHWIERHQLEVLAIAPTPEILSIK